MSFIASYAQFMTDGRTKNCDYDLTARHPMASAQKYIQIKASIAIYLVLETFEVH